MFLYTIVDFYLFLDEIKDIKKNIEIQKKNQESLQTKCIIVQVVCALSHGGKVFCRAVTGIVAFGGSEIGIEKGLFGWNHRPRLLRELGYRGTGIYSDNETQFSITSSFLTKYPSYRSRILTQNGRVVVSELKKALMEKGMDVLISDNVNLEDNKK